MADFEVILASILTGLATVVLAREGGCSPRGLKYASITASLFVGSTYLCYLGRRLRGSRASLPGCGGPNY